MVTSEEAKPVYRQAMQNRNVVFSRKHVNHGEEILQRIESIRLFELQKPVISSLASIVPALRDLLDLTCDILNHQNMEASGFRKMFI